MGVPQAIRRVPRPRNTVVIDTGTQGPLRYAVRQRSEPVTLAGGTRQARNGRTLGHIINGIFVPRKDAANPAPQWLSVSTASLVHSMCSDIASDLAAAAGRDMACAMLAAACLHLDHPAAPLTALPARYASSLAASIYPGLGREQLLQAVSCADLTAAEDFFGRRLHSVPARERLLLHCPLPVTAWDVYAVTDRQNTGPERCLLAAWDMVRQEPLCAAIHEASQVTPDTLPSLARAMHCEDAIVFTDSAARAADLAECAAKSGTLHYLVPARITDKLLRRLDLDLSSPDLHRPGRTADAIPGANAAVHEALVCRLDRDAERQYFYALASPARSHAAETARQDATADAPEKGGRKGRKRGKEGKDSKDGRDDKNAGRDSLGLVLFRSDLDLAADCVFRARRAAYLLELVLRQSYPAGGCPDTALPAAKDQGALFSFLCCLVTSRLLQQTSALGLLADMTFGQIVDILGRVQRSAAADTVSFPLPDDGCWLGLDQEACTVLQTLGLLQR